MLDIIVAGSINCLLFLLSRDLLPSDDFEKWLNVDHFTGYPEKDSSKKYLFYELNRLKDRFRTDMKDSGSIQNENGGNLSPTEIYNQVQGHKNRINKVRLIIQNEFSILNNLHKPSGVKYIVARAYWLDNSGKRFRKFSKNIGPEDRVKVNGKISESMLGSVAKDLEDMMWKEYLFEYPKW